jgi:hypothetical protein
MAQGNGTHLLGAQRLLGKPLGRGETPPDVLVHGSLHPRCSLDSLDRNYSHATL